MKCYFGFLAATMYLLLGTPATLAQAPDRPELKLLSVEKIWDKGPHNAFTDLIRYDNRWVCAFREASSHDGGIKGSSIRVLESSDGKNWNAVASLSDSRGDVRDAKLAVLPDGRLILLTAVQFFDTSAQSHQSIAFYTRDLKTWEGPVDVGEPDFWMWGIRVENGAAYSIGYATRGRGRVRLYRSTDGVKFQPIVKELDVDAAYPNEGALYFDRNGDANLVLRVEPRGEDKRSQAYLGIAHPPCTEWTLKRGNLHIGGPALTRTPDGHLLGVGRFYQPQQHVSLFWIDPESAIFTEALKLPSSGDAGYPGLVWHDGVLNISYYSSHEGKSSIYFARVVLSDSEP